MTRRFGRICLAACATVGLTAGVGMVGFAGRQARSQTQHSSECAAVQQKFLGVGLGADRLANLEVGLRGRQVSYRFKAASSARVESVRVFVRVGPGYSAGDGGRIRISIQSDDGSASHVPSGQILGSTTADRVAIGPFNRLFKLDEPSAPLIAGAIYHIVFTNIGPDPDEQFVSVNDLESLGAPGPFGRGPASALTKDAGQSDWYEHVRHVPIFALEYSNGCHQGQGYMDALSRSGVFQIGGENRVRETMHITGGDRRVSSVAIRIRRAPGTAADLVVRLIRDTGDVVATGNLEATHVPENYDWVTFTFPTAQTLHSGKTYNLELSSTGTYDTFPIQSGVAYGFDVPGLFRDGEYQTNNGQGWKSESRNLQLQFYFNSETR